MLVMLAEIFPSVIILAGIGIVAPRYKFNKSTKTICNGAKCQGHKKEEWIQKREAELLPCSYYHLVFTLPEELNFLALKDPKLLYKTLFDSAWETLNQFGKTEQMQLGMIAILHTWGQNLALHPHLHCIVPGGGIDENGKWKKKVRTDKYLFSVKALSKVFRAKFCQKLKENCTNDYEKVREKLWSKNWVVYAKRPFGGPKQVIEYLGRYIHPVRNYTFILKINF